MGSRMISRPPNTRVQRTRSSPSALRSPLTRHPLGARRMEVAVRVFKPTRLAAVLAWILSEVASAGAVPNDAEQVRALQNDLIKAYINHDIGEIDRILADDYTFVSDQGEVET